MADLASRTEMGGRVGDTNGAFVITRVFRDGVYAWDPQIEEKFEEIENELDEISEVDHLQLIQEILVF